MVTRFARSDRATCGVARWSLRRGQPGRVGGGVGVLTETVRKSETGFANNAAFYALELYDFCPITFHTDKVLSDRGSTPKPGSDVGEAQTLELIEDPVSPTLSRNTVDGVRSVDRVTESPVDVLPSKAVAFIANSSGLSKEVGSYD